MRRRCLSTSKCSSSIHTARSRWSGTSLSFQRNFGTRGIRSSRVRRTSSKLKRSDSDGSNTVSPPMCWCHAGVSVDRKRASVPDRRFMRPACPQRAVDEDVDARHERGIVGDEEGDHRRHLRGLADAAERCVGEHLAHDRLLLELLAVHGRVDEAGRQRHHPSAAWSPPDRGSSRGPQDADLREAVSEPRVAAHQVGGAVEEVGGERVAEQRLLLGVDERCDLVGGRGAEAHRDHARLDEPLERIEEELRPRPGSRSGCAGRRPSWARCRRRAPPTAPVRGRAHGPRATRRRLHLRCRKPRQWCP